MGQCHSNRYLTELWGTFLLVFCGCGSAILAGPQIGFLGVALCFGITLLFLIYSIGSVSGCHLNPAVTLCLTLASKFDKKDVPGYVIAQLIGAAAAGYALYAIASEHSNFNLSSGFALNGYGEHSPQGYSMMACFLTEIITTTILLYAILSSTCEKSAPGFAGLFIGASLIVIHLVAIPVTNGSFNFARTFGVAVVHGGWALTEMWFFLVTNIVAAFAAFGIYKVTHCDK